MIRWDLRYVQSLTCDFHIKYTFMWWSEPYITYFLCASIWEKIVKKNDKKHGKYMYDGVPTDSRFFFW